MRLSRLDLTRYGAFTDTSLDLGAEAGSPDLHIVYGANEAGKSTLRAAINDLLFGVPTKSRYAFLHDYKAMEVGATMEVGGERISWRRLKRSKEDLVDASGRAVNRALLDAALAGMDRETFELMFSLDGETLKKGGEELYRSRGRLGEALFAATSGLSSISASLDEVRGEAEHIFKPRGRKHRLKQLRDELDSVDAELKAVTVNAPQYRQRVEAFDEARHAYEGAKRDAVAVKKRLEQIKRWQNAMRDWTKLRMARERLAPLCGTPDIDEHTAARIHDLDDQAGRLRRDIDQANTALQRLNDARDEMVPDAAILAESPRIDRLARLETSFHEARENLPKAEAEAAAEQGRLSATMEKLGLQGEADPRDLLVPAPLAGQLDEHIRAHDAVIAKLESAREEAEHAQAALDELRRSAEGLGEPIDDAIMHQLHRDTRAARTAADTSNLEEAVASAAEKRDAALAELRPWEGTAETLRTLNAPDIGSLSSWADELANLTEQHAQAARHCDEQTRRAEEFHAAIAELQAATGLTSDDDIAHKRTQRDAAWRAHRRVISTGELGHIVETADAFEAAMRADDDTRDHRERHNDEAAQLRQFRVEAARAVAASQNDAKKREAAAAALAATWERIDAASADLGLPAGWHPDRIKAWLERRDRALAAQQELKTLQAKLTDQQNSRRALAQRLAETLVAAGAAPAPNMALDALLDFAEAVIQRAENDKVKRAHKREELTKAKAAFQARERRLAEAENAREKWTARWGVLLESCWLGQQEREREVAEVRQILGLVEDLRRSLERTDALQHDIESWRVEVTNFTALCREVCVAANVPFDENEPGQAALALGERLEAARELRIRREQTESEIKRVGKALTDAEQSLETVEWELNTLCERFGVSDASALRGAIDKAREKARIGRDIGELQESLRAAFDGRALNEIEKELAACDPDALSVDVQTLAEEIEARDETVQGLYHQMKKAQETVEAVGADEKAAALGERRRGVLVQIEAEARRYLRLTAGVAAADAAIRAYRDRHRSAMMLNAARCFRHITGGRFTDLISQPAETGEILIAIQSGGGSKEVGELSDGTRDQLYLALRMSGYQEFAATREPLPLIADDIMQSFDDDRARASFAMLSDIAELGQVIYLTHHAHLCELARHAVGGAVTIHELPAPEPGAQAAAMSEPAG